MDLKELTNNKLIKDFQCISIKSKKEPHLRCPCKKKIINGSYQLFCGKHNKTKTPIIFNENIKVSKEKQIYTTENLPKCNECNIIKMYNTLDYYKIKYNKDETFQQLYNKLNNILKLSQKYSIHKDKIICIQKNIRKYLIYRFKHFTNKEDFYSLDSIYQIPLKFIHIIKDTNNISYCFDIRSLYKYIQINKKEIINPFKNIPFTTLELENIMKKINSIKKNELIIEKDVVSPRQYYKQYLVKVFQKFDSLGYLTNIEWFTSLTFIQIKQLYKKCEDIWNYRAELSLEQKKNIVHDGRLFTIPINYISRLSSSKDLELRKNILNEFDKAISQGITTADKNHGAILMLTGFAEVSEGVRESFPWLSQTFT